MKILITGAGGFVGQLLAEQLLKSDQTHELLLTDIFEPPIPAQAPTGANATCLKADLSDPASLHSIVRADLDAIYAFHGIMSAGSEENLELGYQVNLHSTLALLEAVRASCRPGVRFIYASSTAIYGQPLPEMPSEATVATPQGSYGTQKAMVEYAVNDYTRRGVVTGFALRFPTISVRPGAPTQAASSWMSGIIREPLQGRPAVLPVDDDGFEAWLCSPRTLARNLVHVLTLPPGALPAHVRQVNLPGVTTSVREMLDALRAVGGDKAVALVRREPATDEIRAILDSWPTRFDVSRALALGFVADQNFCGAVEDFAEGLKR